MDLRVFSGKRNNGRNGNGRNGHGSGNGGVRSELFHSERVFRRHLSELVNRQVTVSTTCGVLRGRLGGVFVDHILVTVNGTEHHVRLEEICWVAVERNGNGG